MSVNQPILAIPGVFQNINEERIRHIFNQLNLGVVERVDIRVPKTPVGEEGLKKYKLNRVFIYMNWNDSEQSVKVRERLAQGKDIKIIYDHPWFWRVSAYVPPRAGGRKRKSFKRRLSRRKTSSKRKRH